MTINVSAGGNCAGPMRVLPVGTHLEDLIFLGRRDASLSGQATWARPDDSSLNLMGKIGVRFVEIDPAFARSLDAGDANQAQGAA